MDGETRYGRCRNSLPLRNNQTPFHQHQQYLNREKQNSGNIWTQVSLSVRKLIRKNKKSNLDKKSKGPPTIPLYYYYPQKNTDYLSQLENMCQMYHKKVQNLNKLRSSFANDLLARNKLLMKQNKKLMQLNKEQDEKEELFNRGLRLVFESYQNEKKISELNATQIKSKTNSKTNNQTFIKNKYPTKRSIFTLTDIPEKDRNKKISNIEITQNKPSVPNETHNISQVNIKSDTSTSRIEYLSRINHTSKDYIQSIQKINHHENIKKCQEQISTLPDVNMKIYSSPNGVKLWKSESDKKLDATCYNSSVSSYRSHTRLNTDSLDIRPVKLENKKKQTKYSDKGPISKSENLSGQTFYSNSILSIDEKIDKNVRKDENFRNKLKRLPLIISSNIYNSEISQKILKEEKPFVLKESKRPMVQKCQVQKGSLSVSHNLNHLPPIKSSVRSINLKKCQEWNDSQSPKTRYQNIQKRQNTQNYKNSNLLTKVNVIKQITHQKLKNENDKVEIFNPVVKWPPSTAEETKPNRTILLPMRRKNADLLDTTELKHNIKNDNISNKTGQKVAACILESTLNSLSEMADIVRQNIEDELSSRIKNIQVGFSKQSSFKKTHTQTQTDLELSNPSNQETLFDFKTTRKIISSFFKHKLRDRIISEMDSMSEHNDSLVRTAKNKKQMISSKNNVISSKSDSMLVNIKNVDFPRNRLPPLYPRKALNVSTKIENWLKTNQECPIVEDTIPEEISPLVPSMEQQCDCNSTKDSGSYFQITNYPKHDNMSNIDIIEKVSLPGIDISASIGMDELIQQDNSNCCTGNTVLYQEKHIPLKHETWLKNLVNIDLEKTSLPEISIPSIRKNSGSWQEITTPQEHENWLKIRENEEFNIFNVANIEETSLPEIDCLTIIGKHSSNSSKNEQSMQQDYFSNCSTEDIVCCQQEISTLQEHENWLKNRENQECNMFNVDNIEKTYLPETVCLTIVNKHSSNSSKNEPSVQQDYFPNCSTEDVLLCQQEITTPQEHENWLKIRENQESSIFNVHNIEENSLPEIDCLTKAEHYSSIENENEQSMQQNYFSICTTKDNKKEILLCEQEITTPQEHENSLKNRENQECNMFNVDNEETSLPETDCLTIVDNNLSIRSEKEQLIQQANCSNCRTEDIGFCQQEITIPQGHENWLQTIENQECDMVNVNMEETSPPEITIAKMHSPAASEKEESIQHCSNFCTKDNGSCQQETATSLLLKSMANVDIIEETYLPEISSSNIRDKHSSISSKKEQNNYSNCSTEDIGSYHQEKHASSEYQDCLKITRENQTEQKCTVVEDNIEETTFQAIYSPNVDVKEENMFEDVIKLQEIHTLPKVSKCASEESIKQQLDSINIQNEWLKNTSIDDQPVDKKLSEIISSEALKVKAEGENVDSECCTSEFCHLEITNQEEIIDILKPESCLAVIDVVEQVYPMVEDIKETSEVAISSNVSKYSLVKDENSDSECLPEVSSNKENAKKSNIEEERPKTSRKDNLMNMEEISLLDQADSLDVSEIEQLPLENGNSTVCSKHENIQEIIELKETTTVSDNEISVPELTILPIKTENSLNESYQEDQAIFKDVSTNLGHGVFENKGEQKENAMFEVYDQIEAENAIHHTQKDVKTYENDISIQSENNEWDNDGNLSTNDIQTLPMNHDVSKLQTRDEVLITEKAINILIPEHQEVSNKDENIEISNESIQEDLDAKYILYEILNFIEQSGTGENLHETCPSRIDNIKSDTEEINKEPPNIFDDIIHELYLDPRSCINYFSDSLTEMGIKRKESIDECAFRCEDIDRQECVQNELIADEFEDKGTIQSKVHCTSTDEEQVQRQSNEVRQCEMDEIKQEKGEESCKYKINIEIILNQSDGQKPCVRYAVEKGKIIAEDIYKEIKPQNEEREIIEKVRKNDLKSDITFESEVAESIKNQPPCLDNTGQEKHQICLEKEITQVFVGSILSSLYEDIYANIDQIPQEIVQRRVNEIIQEQNLIEDSQAISESIEVRDVNNDIVHDTSQNIDQEYTKQQDGGQITCEIELLTGQFRCDSDDGMDQDSGKHVTCVDIGLIQDTNRKVDQIIWEIEPISSVCKENNIEECQKEHKETCEQDINTNEIIYDGDEWESDEDSCETQSIDKNHLIQDLTCNDQLVKDICQNIQEIKNNEKHCEENENTTDEWTTDEEDQDADDVICQQDLSKPAISQKDVASIFNVERKEEQREIYEEFLELKKRKLDCYNEPFREKTEEIDLKPTYFNKKILDNVKFQSEPIRPKSKPNQHKYVHFDTNIFPVKVQMDKRKTSKQLDIDPKENIIHKVLKYEISTSSRMANYSINANISPINKNIK